MNEDSLRALMRRLNIQVGRRTSKGWMNGSCPFAPWKHKNHTDKSPSFGVFVSDNGRSTYSCYGCKMKGTISGLIKQLEAYRKADYGDVLGEADRAEEGIGAIPDFETAALEEDPLPEPLEEAMWDGMFGDIEEWPVCMNFLAHRRVSLEAARKIGLEYDPEQGRVLFPVRGAQGELYGFSGRAVFKDAKLKVRDYAGLPKRFLILGRERWVEGRPVLLTEGLIGYARLITEGVDEIVNVGAALGSEITQHKADLLADFGHGVYLMLDPDPAGDDGIFGPQDVLLKRRRVEDSALGRLWGKVPLFIPDYPEEVGDIDDLTKAHVEVILRETPLYAPDPKTLKILRGPRS